MMVLLFCIEAREAISWSEAISGMLTAPLQNTESSSAEEELQKVADLIGCRLEITGERPAQRRYQLLMYTAIREALTNAVRHGGATALKTQISRDKSTCIIKISNNGRPPEKNISEGGGLGNLRKTLEREGAGLSYSFEDGFALVISLPVAAIPLPTDSNICIESAYVDIAATAIIVGS